MKQLLLFALVSISLLTLSSFNDQKGETYSLTVEVKDLQNSKGVVQFALYNKDGTIPDEDYKKCCKILKEKIQNGSSKVTFNNLPLGKYAVNILHDENENGEIDKGFILPIEGVGFSNYQSIGLTNRPNFSKASFTLDRDKKISIKIIYL
ncbi:MAG: DUF2141 domain-containing protein [Bacteroidia bacterium]|nr:DUF2141 domain-containing protein [Bacteroidia bacterium]MBN8694456.1 DUF2141 domain-containing protein [Bacteroidota bacterium]